MKFGSNGPTVPTHCAFFNKTEESAKCFLGKIIHPLLVVISKNGINSCAHKARTTIAGIRKRYELKHYFLVEFTSIEKMYDFP